MKRGSRPHYMEMTAACRAKQQPRIKKEKETKKNEVKPESRLPPRIVVIKQVASPPRRRDALLLNLTAMSLVPQADIPVKSLKEAILVPVKTPSTKPIISSGEAVKRTAEESSSETPKKIVSTSPE